MNDETGSLGWLHGRGGASPLEVVSRHGVPLSVFASSLASVSGVSTLKARKWLGLEPGRVSTVTCALIEAALRRREEAFVDIDVEAERARRMDADARVLGVSFRNLLWGWGFEPRCYPTLHSPYPGDRERLPALHEAPCVIEVDVPPLRLVIPPLRLGTPAGNAIRRRLRSELILWRQKHYLDGRTVGP